MKHPAPEPPDIHSESFLRSLMARQLKLSIAAPARRMPNMAAYEAYLK